MEPDQPVTDARPLSRRAFLAGTAVAAAGALGAVALVGLTRKAGRPLAGGFVEDGSAAGHAIRDGASRPAVARVDRVPVVIVGGGIAGLSAAWWLRRAGMHDFTLLELAPEAGGNSRGGSNEVSAYPWGAHYVPVPGPRAEHVRLLFTEMGVLGPDGRWSERDLAFAPRERTFVHGRWRDGQEEAVSEGLADRDELRRLADEIEVLRHTGQFTLPMSLGARPGSPLDAVTAEAWLRERGYRGRAVHWLVNYACRDDFGTSARDTSAWAAVHYFAARERDTEGPLTWPEGNAHIARYLAGTVARSVVTGSPVHRVERRGSGMRVRASDRAWDCDVVIWAAPTFVAQHVVEDAPHVRFDYAPWMVSNLTLDRWPRDAGAPAGAHGDPPSTAWDNVIADSPSLGYVVATHQSVRAVQERTVWTHYWALSGGDPRVERRRLLAADWRSCAEWELADLERAHPDVRDCVSRVDVLRYGHAMPRPVPGFLAARRELWSPPADSRVLYANSDVSGLSLFEEAQHRGITAADRAMGLLGRG
ncbi:MAG: FAD-dependent oxidoreductase [Gemmatimonadales bacterium]